MRTRLTGAIAALALALGALAVPSATPVSAGSACTGWTSSFVPPTSIRVYRTASGRTQTLPFRQYVERVMASEWGPSAPAAALQVGAIAAKQYAWYFAMHWRGGRDRAGECYDVVDTWRDQVYNHRKAIVPAHADAVAATWWVSLRKNDRLFLTGYRAGGGSCTARNDGWRLYQQNAVACVRRHGETAEMLARRFFSNVSWIMPGAGDFTGDGRGDLAILTVAPDTGATTGHVRTSDLEFRATVDETSPEDLTLTTTMPDRLLGRAAGDVSGDRRGDIVQLVRTDAGLALEVVQAADAGFVPAVTWWIDAPDGTGLGEGTYRLLLADFDADGLVDAGIVRIRPGAPPPPEAPPETPPGPPETALFIARSTGSGFEPAVLHWAAPLDLASSELRAGDLDGDGLADLVALTPAETGGTAIQVARSDPSGVLGPIETWATEPAVLDAVRVLVADPDRDGRDDLVVVRRTLVGGVDGSEPVEGVRIIVYRGPLTGTTLRPLYFTDTLPLPFSATRLSTADLTGDGRSDLVALVDRGVDAEGNPSGSAAWRLFSTGTRFELEPWFEDPALRWETAFPY